MIYHVESIDEVIAHHTSDNKEGCVVSPHPKEMSKRFETQAIKQGLSYRRVYSQAVYIDDKWVSFTDVHPPKLYGCHVYIFKI